MAPSSKDSNLEQWELFASRCLTTRLDVLQFTKFSKLLSRRCPVRSSEIANIFLTPTSKRAEALDPRIPSYVEKLLDISLIELPDVLESLLLHSHFHRPNDGLDNEKKPAEDKTSWRNPTELDEIILFRVSKAINMGRSPKTFPEALGIINAASNWMSDVANTSTVDQIDQNMTGAPGSLPLDAINVREAVGMLVMTMADNPKITSILGGSCPKDVKQKFAKSLSLYIPFLVATSPQSAARLETFLRQHGIYETAASNASGGGIDHVIANANNEASQGIGMESLNIADGPPLNTRAGLYIYLNAALVGRPLTDDHAIISHLNARYKGDVSSSTIDLITASFDVLSNAMVRNESSSTLLLFRSFLINKIPLLIALLSSSMFPPITPEYCISQALKFVDPQAFPSFSAMFDPTSDSSIFSDVRQDFLFACCLHGLVLETNIETLLGETPMQTLPSSGRYEKDQLVSQCLTEPDKMETYVGELEDMNGNVGAIAMAISEVITTLCNSKETMSLKSVCIILARKPSSLDVILLFTSVGAVVQPLCYLLDNWRYEDDQGEHQPVYEEFGVILLLVLTFVYRYDLSLQDLEITSQDSFILQFLQDGSKSKQLEDLTEEQNKQLGGWLLGMYKEGEISDDLMSSCTPQQFYLLVPTLFYQSILAFSNGKLNQESLKGGLEYLLEIFLLPSLIKGLSWFASYLWQQRPDPELASALKILSILLKPSSISGDAQTIHTTILSLTSKSLETELRALSSSSMGLKRSDISPLLTALAPHTSNASTCTIQPTRSERSTWTSIPQGGLLSSLRQTLHSLILWASTPSLSTSVASYTHRQLLYAVSLLGAVPVLRAMLAELKLQFSSVNGEIALDVLQSFICAPAPHKSTLTLTTTSTTAAVASSAQLSLLHNSHHLYEPLPLTLRDALRLEVEEQAPKLLVTDPLDVESTVRLHRRVEAFVAAVGMLQVPDVDVMHAVGTGLKVGDGTNGGGGGDTAAVGNGVGGNGGDAVLQTQGSAGGTAGAGNAHPDAAKSLDDVLGAVMDDDGDMFAAMSAGVDLGEDGGMGMDLG